MGNLLFENVRIIKENEILNGYNLSVEKGKISKIFSGKSNQEFEQIIDGRDMYLSPGFIDVHNHGNSGWDVMDGTDEALKGIAAFHAKNGVTGFAATTMTSSFEKTLSSIKNIVDFEKNTNAYSNGARLMGIYLEGPYFNIEKKGAQPGNYIKNTDLQELKEYISCGKELIKIVALAPELNNSIDVIKYLTEKKIVVSCGHSNSTYEEAVKGIEAGISEATQLYNGMRSFSHIDPGIVGAVLLDKNVVCEIICDGIHVHYGAIDMAYRLKGREGLILISDAMRASGLDDGEYDLGGQIVYVKGNEARLKDGTLAGSTLTLDKAVKNLIKNVNIPLVDAVMMASFNGAKKLGLSEITGSIDEGKDADLIIFDENINIQKVYIKGNEII